MQKNQAISAPVRLPEARISKFSSDGSMKLLFTSEISFPEGIVDRIKEEKQAENRRRLANEEIDTPSLVQIFAVSDEDSELSSPNLPLLADWDS